MVLLSLPFLLLPLRATDVICACRWLRFLLLSFALRSTWPHESVCRARPPRFARGIAAPPGALSIGVLQERRHIPCRVMQVAETHSSQLSNSTTPLRQWSPSLILQVDPSMSPLSRPPHKLIWPRRLRALSSPWLPSRRAAPADPPRQPQLLQDASAFLCNFPGAACVGLVMQGFDKAFWVAGGDQ